MSYDDKTNKHILNEAKNAYENGDWKNSEDKNTIAFKIAHSENDYATKTAEIQKLMVKHEIKENKFKDQIVIATFADNSKAYIDSRAITTNPLFVDFSEQPK